MLSNFTSGPVSFAVMLRAPSRESIRACFLDSVSAPRSLFFRDVVHNLAGPLGFLKLQEEQIDGTADYRSRSGFVG